MSVMVREEPLFKLLLNSPKLFLYQSALKDVIPREQQKREAFYQWITAAYKIADILSNV